MKKETKIFLSCALILSICLAAGVYALSRVKVENHFETGIVDISLKEYQMRNGKEEKWEDGPVVLPGQTVSKIPRITNHGNDCYVRAEVDLKDSGLKGTGDLGGMPEDWILGKDGHFYYKKILKTGKTVDLFKTVHIPEDLPQKYEGKKIHLKIRVDAVQSKNFTPDYEKMEPWGKTEIQKCKKEGQYDIRTFKRAESEKFQIVYEGDMKRLVKNQDDFFRNFPYLMPGDRWSGEAELKNDSRQRKIICFRSEAEDPSTLPDRIRLKIETETDGKRKLFYEGNLRAEELVKKKKLCVLKPESSGRLIFTITVPPELDNRYTILKSHVTWIFSTEDEETAVSRPPQTGDAGKTGTYILLLLTAAGGMIFFARKTGTEKLKKTMEKGMNLIVTLIVIQAGILGLLYVAGIRPYVVVSGSMEPAIQTGSVCFVNERAGYDTVKRGDIIVFKVMDQMVTHRVSAVTDRGFETKGDNNESGDGLSTTRENFRGKTLGSIPKLGYLVKAMHTEKGRWICLSAAAAFLILYMAVSSEESEETAPIRLDKKKV